VITHTVPCQNRHPSPWLSLCPAPIPARCGSRKAGLAVGGLQPLPVGQAPAPRLCRCAARVSGLTAGWVLPAMRFQGEAQRQEREHSAVAHQGHACADAGVHWGGGVWRARVGDPQEAAGEALLPACTSCTPACRLRRTLGGLWPKVCSVASSLPVSGSRTPAVLAPASS
jgi:hypothetical protein